MRKTLYLLLVFVISFTTFTFGTVSMPNQSYADETVEEVLGQTLDFRNGSIGRLNYRSGKKKSFIAKGNQATVKVRQVVDVGWGGLFRNAPRVNALLQEYNPNTKKYSTIYTIPQMANGQTRVFPTRLIHGKRYRIKFEVKNTHPKPIRVNFKLYQKQVGNTSVNNDRNNSRSSDDRDSNSTQPSSNNTVQTTSNHDGNNVSSSSTGDTPYFSKKEGKAGRKSITKANGNPIKIKINKVQRDGWGPAPAVNIHLQEYQGANANPKYKTVQTHKNVGNGKTRAFTKGIKQGKRYRFYFTLDKDWPDPVQVDYTAYELNTDNITSDFKFYPSYSKGNIYVKVKRVSNKQTPKLTGEVRFSANGKGHRIHKTNWDKSYNLSAPDQGLKMPAKGKKKSVNLRFIGLMGNDPVRIGHNITLDNREGEINVHHSIDDGKLNVRGQLPNNFLKNGTWKIKLIDQANDKTIDEVTEKNHDKRSFSHKFNASDVENKNYQIKITYSKFRAANQSLIKYSGSGSKKVNNLVATTTPTTPSPSPTTSTENDGQADDEQQNSTVESTRDDKDNSTEEQTSDDQGNNKEEQTSDDQGNNKEEQTSDDQDNSKEESTSDDKDNKSEEQTNNNQDHKAENTSTDAKITVTPVILNNDRVDVQANLTNVNEPKGDWIFTLNNGTPHRIPDEEGSAKTTFSTKDIPENEVPITVEFNGKDANNQDVSVKVTETIQIKETSNITEDDQDDNKEEFIVQTPEDDPVEETATHQTSTNEPVGGELPKTATNYSFGLIAGILLLAGGGLLIYLRRRTF